jgi:hypothetical protein
MGTLLMDLRGVAESDKMRILHPGAGLRRGRLSHIHPKKYHPQSSPHFWRPLRDRGRPTTQLRRNAPVSGKPPFCQHANEGRVQDSVGNIIAVLLPPPVQQPVETRHLGCLFCCLYPVNDIHPTSATPLTETPHETTVEDRTSNLNEARI